MAWNYRKRIKIAPGVHLNFSKNGISTSIGPKGAKVTFGKNGTYMSTSIPGTGLYSRQKISGTGSSCINHENDNKGCFECFYIFICISLLVFGGICISSRNYFLIFVGFVLLGISFLIFYKSFLEKKDEYSSTEADGTFVEEDSNNNDISQIAPPINPFTDEQRKSLGYLDPLFEDVAIFFIQSCSGSISMIQRKFAIGYNRAGRIMDQLEEKGVVGPSFGSAPRELLIHSIDEWLLLKNNLLSELDKQKAKETITKTEVSEPSLSHCLTENQFDLIKTASNNLCAFMSKVGRKRTVRAKLDEMVQLENSDGTPWEVSKKVRLVIITDVYRCYKGLGHNFFIDDDKENIGIYLFMSKYLKPDFEIGYNNLSDFILKAKNSFVDVLKTSELVNQNTQMAPNEFFLQRALGECDRDLQTQYMTLLYRFASAVAKADGQVNETEEKWLADIMKSKELNIGNGSNVRRINKQEQESLESPYDMLDGLIGLASVKDEITKLANFIKIQQVRESKGMKTPEISYHCVFTGNPGTGKTTVARIMASIYRDLGILKKGHLVETDRSGLVAEYVGQTAIKTNKIIDSALDGVLFIDEAYSLVQGAKEDFGQEAISTLLKRMEDDRNRLVVILAGYSSEMKAFIDSNPGLQSRFNRYIQFPDYSADELKQIFLFNAKKNQYTLDEEASSMLEEMMSSAIDHKDKNFGNARFVRNLFEKSIQNQATRLSSQSNITEDILSMLKAEDLPTD